MEEQNKMDELFKLMGFIENEKRDEAKKQLRHKPYQNDYGKIGENHE